MDILNSPDEMTQWSRRQALSGKSISFVPTMGFFHEGHLRLMRKAKESADLVVVSLFVNPTQFGPNEDLDSYPRNFERDQRLAEAEGVAVLFAPTPDLIYPQGFQTEVVVKELPFHLCGKNRPGHFNGVTTVVTKLFNMVLPQNAVFGEKDFQQLAVIRRMVQDLNIPVEIIGHPIVRESDGLAMSSRNKYLTASNRSSALSLSQSLQLARDSFQQGVSSTAELTEIISAHIGSFVGTEIDYVSFVDCDNLQSVDQVDRRTLLALAVRIDSTVRLIDNGFVVL